MALYLATFSLPFMADTPQEAAEQLVATMKGAEMSAFTIKVEPELRNRETMVIVVNKDWMDAHAGL